MTTASLPLQFGGALVNALTVLVLAPLFEGILRKVTARIQSRQGPPLWQPYFDLLKLLGKEDLESGEAPVMQRVAAYLAFAVPLTLAGMLPLGYPAPLDPSADILVLVYLLALSSIATLLAGLAAGSTFSLLGISREMMLVITLEPLLVVALLVGAVHVRSLRINEVLDGSVYAAGRFPVSGLIMLVLLLFSLQAFLKRLPFDIAEAETEIMEGPLVEYSGPKLALFKHAQMAKLILYGAILINLFAPWGNHLAFPLSLAVFWLKVGVLVLGATWVAATHARYRIDQAVRYFAVLLGISAAALVLATLGY
jgi:formate hydrogenlyase subunit 4